MDSIADFVALVRDELGLPVTVEEASQNLDQVPGWDSVQLLALLTLVERRTGRQISLPDMLRATSLKHLYDLVTTS